MGSVERAPSEIVAVARLAAGRFGLTGDPRFVHRGANDTFVVEGGGQHFNLRIHNPSYHSPASILGERLWLNALAMEADVRVPTPHKSRNGEWVVSVQSPGGDGAFACTASEWIDGVQRNRNPAPAHFRAVGETMARLHAHAQIWSPPREFVRPVWDAGGVFWERTHGGSMLERALMKMTPAQAELIARAKDRSEVVFCELRDLPNSWGLIHADLHLSNVVFNAARACPIDFDDCGFGSHLYDAAVAVHFHRSSPQIGAFVEALLEGYERVGHFPRHGMSLFDSLLAVRSASVAVWIAAQSDYNEGFRENLETYLESLTEDLIPFVEGETAVEIS